MVTFTRTLAQVREHVLSDDSGKWDTPVPSRNLTLHGGRLIFPEAQDRGFELGLTPTPWARMQMCQKLGIPTAYFKRCPAHLQDAQFNHWKEHPAESEAADSPNRDSAWLLRAKDSLVRGVLSERYARLDNAQVLDALHPLAAASRFQVGWFALSSESLHLRLVDPGLARAVLPGDDLMVGVHVANSEVGKRAVTVDAMVFRLICTNGLIRKVAGKSLLYQRHLHVSTPRFAEALAAALREALTVAAGFIDQMARATRTPVPDVEGTITALAARWSLSETTQELMKLSLLGESASQQETLYGLVNALTNAAQRLPIDERYDLEVLAGSLLDGSLPASPLLAPATRSLGHAPRNGHARVAPEPALLAV